MRCEKPRYLSSSCSQHNKLAEEGILCTAESKAKLLGAFLDRLNWKPKHIIFIDDTRSHLQDVMQEMEKRAISCTGYEYLAAYAMPITLDKALVALQFQHLIEHEEWLSQQKKHKDC